VRGGAADVSVVDELQESTLKEVVVEKTPYINHDP
jgi:hypothetical protein